MLMISVWSRILELENFLFYVSSHKLFIGGSLSKDLGNFICLILRFLSLSSSKFKLNRIGENCSNVYFLWF